jgi:hypothetical protein
MMLVWAFKRLAHAGTIGLNTLRGCRVIEKSQQPQQEFGGVKR